MTSVNEALNIFFDLVISSRILMGRCHAKFYYNVMTQRGHWKRIFVFVMLRESMSVRHTVLSVPVPSVCQLYKKRIKNDNV